MTEPEVRVPALKRADGCVTAMFVLIGIALLLPGVCSLVFMAAFLPDGTSVGGFAWLWGVTFVIAAGGIWLIRYAIRHR